MRWRSQYLSSYPLLWVGVLLTATLLVWIWIYRMPAAPQFSTIDSRQVKRLADEPSRLPAQSIDERTSNLVVKVEGVELTLSSSDGKLKLHVWAKQAAKDATQYRIDKGALRFAMENRDTLLVQMTDASFVQQSDLVSVKGTLVGQIVETGQYFEAEELSWDRRTSTVVAAKVTFTSSVMRVTGTQMEIDLQTKALTFHGPVEAGI